MSFWYTFNVVHGYKIPYDIKTAKGKRFHPHDEEYLPYVEGRPGVKYTLVYNDSLGDYFVFGISLASLSKDQCGKFIEIPNCHHHEGLEEMFNELFGKFNLPPMKPSVFAFVDAS